MKTFGKAALIITGMILGALTALCLLLLQILNDPEIGMAAVMGLFIIPLAAFVFLGDLAFLFVLIHLKAVKRRK